MPIDEIVRAYHSRARLTPWISNSVDDFTYGRTVRPIRPEAVVTSLLRLSRTIRYDTIRYDDTIQYDTTIRYNSHLSFKKGITHKQHHLLAASSCLF